MALSLALAGIAALTSAASEIAAGSDPAAVAPHTLRAGLFVFDVSLGMCVGAAFMVALAAGIDERYAIAPPVAGHGTRVSRRNWLVSTFTLGLASGLLFTVAVGDGAPERGPGRAHRHWVLRWLLARAGLATWAHVSFLEHAARRNLIRRRGGGYEFIHRLVMEHFLQAT